MADQSFHIETFQLFIFQLDEDDLSFETQNFNEKLCKLKTFLLDISIHIMVRSLMVDIYKTACALSAEVSTPRCFPVIREVLINFLLKNLRAQSQRNPVSQDRPQSEWSVLHNLRMNNHSSSCELLVRLLDMRYEACRVQTKEIKTHNWPAELGAAAHKFWKQAREGNNEQVTSKSSTAACPVSGAGCWQLLSGEMRVVTLSPGLQPDTVTRVSRRTDTRASNEGSRRFYHHKEAPF